MTEAARAVRRRLIGLLQVIVAVVLIALITLETGQVLMRYVFLTGIAWGRDVITLMMFCLAWLGAPLLWLRAGHIVLQLPLGGAFDALSGHRAMNLLMLVAAPALAVITFLAMQSFAFLDLPSLGTSAAVKFYPILAGAVLLVLAAAINLAAGAEPDAPGPGAVEQSSD